MAKALQHACVGANDNGSNPNISQRNENTENTSININGKPCDDDSANLQDVSLHRTLNTFQITTSKHLLDHYIENNEDFGDLHKLLSWNMGDQLNFFRGT